MKFLKVLFEFMLALLVGLVTLPLLGLAMVVYLPIATLVFVGMETTKLGGDIIKHVKRKVKR